jgi:diaminopimelate epimerase
MSITKHAFTKYHGNGNDFIIVDLTHVSLKPSMSWFINQAQRLCERHTGIGADGLIVLTPQHDRFLITVINADGSVAKNCGNGLRCAAAHIFGKTGSHVATIELHERLYTCQKVFDRIAVSMGTCQITKYDDVYLQCSDIHAQVALGDMGNLHLVLLLNKPIQFDQAVREVQSRLATADMNIGFLFKDEQGRHCSLVFERGVGFTRSCGTGASAAAAFLAFLDPSLTKEHINIVQPGGDLDINIIETNLTEDGGRFTIGQCGRAEQVFTGIFEAEDNC